MSANILAFYHSLRFLVVWCLFEPALKMNHDSSETNEDCEVFISPKNEKFVNACNRPVLTDNSQAHVTELSSKKCSNSLENDSEVEKSPTPFRTPLQSLGSSGSDNKENTAHWNTPVDKSGFTPQSSGKKSFRQQRVDRLYSPGALAQGFLRRSRELSRLLEECEEMDTQCDPPLACLGSLRSRCISFRNENGDCNSAEMEVEESKSQDVQLAAAEVILPIEEEEQELVEVLPPQETECETQDGHYFLKVLKQETDRLDKLAAGADSELASGDSLSEDAKGKLRVASCKARLLIKQKMQQFHGLCQKNINIQLDDQFPTTNEDLAGFWDMVKLQVDHVDQMFEELNVLRKNNWEEKVEVSRLVAPKRRSLSKPASFKAVLTEKQIAIRDTARKAREELRRKIMQERRKLQNDTAEL